MSFETKNGGLRFTIDKEIQENNLLKLRDEEVRDIAMNLAVLDYQKEVNRFSNGLASSVDSISRRDYIINAYLRNKRTILMEIQTLAIAQSDSQKKLK